MSALLFALMLLGAPARAQDAPSSLELAYQKEFAFLVAEKESLEAQLRELEATSARDVALAEAETEALEGRLLATTLSVERAEGRLADLEREATASQDAADALTGTLAQAGSTLTRPGFALPETGDDLAAQSEALRATFQEVARRLEEAGQVRSAAEPFFLPDGTLVDGRVVHVGAIASYGTSDRAAGVLVPAGEGRLRIGPFDAASDARALAAGDPPDVLGAYLYESTKRAVALDTTPWLVKKLHDGGLIGWIILVLGAIALTLVLVRVVLLARLGGGAEKRIGQITERVLDGDLVGARAACRDGGPAGTVLGAVLDNAHLEREALDDVIEEALLRETPRIERFGTAVLVIAAVAPLLGLLGTVTGMIATFDVITEFGTGDPKMLSGGISEALVTTQLGLVVAIPALLLGNLLDTRAGALIDRLQQAALAVTNHLAPIPVSEVAEPPDTVAPVAERRASA